MAAGQAVSKLAVSKLAGCRQLARPPAGQNSTQRGIWRLGAVTHAPAPTPGPSRRATAHSSRKTACALPCDNASARSLDMAPSRPPRPPARPARDPKELLKKRGKDLILKVQDKDRYGIFLEPVDLDTVSTYADVIERPMDLSTAQNNLQMGVYRTPMELRADLDLIWSNCCTFNADDSVYFKEAVRLRALTARYFDDLLRALSRDGVASALGMTNARQNGPSSSRAVGKRPPRHRLGGAHSGGAQSSSMVTSEPTSPEADADASASASASGSASAGLAPSYRAAQVRRAQAASEAAATAASEAEAEAKAAAIAAGIAPKLTSSTSQIFAGPSAILRSPDEEASRLAASRLQTLNPRKARYRCAEIPHAWKRIGRWHTRGATMSRFNSKERALDVRYGRIFQKYVHRSAPMARRILATVLDPEIVREYDQDILSQQPGHALPNGSPPGIEKNGRLKHIPREKSVKNKATSQNSRGNSPHMNGLSDPMDIDENGRIKERPDGMFDPITKYGHVTGSPVGSNGGIATIERKSSKGDQVVNKVLSLGGTETRVLGRDETSKPNCLPSRRAVSRLQLLLKEHGIDPSFLGSLINGLNGSAKSSPQTANADIGKTEGTGMDDIDHILDANHSTLMNVLRLRALREDADEAEREDLEDRERECMEGLAKGMAIAVKTVSPRFVIHPIDAAESAAALSQSILPSQQAQK